MEPNKVLHFYSVLPRKWHRSEKLIAVQRFVELLFCQVVYLERTTPTSLA